MPLTALIIVDVQHDFLPGGALGVPDGDRILAQVARLQAAASLTVASRDFHPAAHMSFTEQGGIWPVHCVAGTHGAELHPDVRADIVIDKATRADVDAYSAFDGTGLATLLRERGVTDVIICGLATDYCVKATVLDALAEGFATTVITDAIAAVNVEPGDGDRAIAQMIEAGAVAASTQEVL